MIGEFVYRVNEGVFVFLVGSIIIVVIASITISFQALNAANFNPADTFRYE